MGVQQNDSLDNGYTATLSLLMGMVMTVPPSDALGPHVRLLR